MPRLVHLLRGMGWDERFIHLAYGVLQRGC